MSNESAKSDADERETEIAQDLEEKADQASIKKGGKASLKQRLEDHLSEYGPIAFVIYLSISALTIAGFYVAISTGLSSGDSSAWSFGTLVAAWLAAKLTLPLRIGATFVLTPLAATLMRKIRRQKPDSKKPSND